MSSSLPLLPRLCWWASPLLAKRLWLTDWLITPSPPDHSRPKKWNYGYGPFQSQALAMSITICKFMLWRANTAAGARLAETH
jgi:hypothetical protein